MKENRRNFTIKAIVGVSGLLAGCANSDQSGDEPIPQDTTTSNQPKSETATKTPSSSTKSTSTTQIKPSGPPETLGPNKTFGPRGGIIKFSQIKEKNIPDGRATINGRKLEETGVLWKNLKEAYQSGTSGTTVSPDQMQHIERTLRNDHAFYYIKYRNKTFELEIIHYA